MSPCLLLSPSFPSCVSESSAAAVSTPRFDSLWTSDPNKLQELLAAVGLVLRDDDAVALHYRHLATQISRHASSPDTVLPISHASVVAEWERLLLDRARGYTVSR